MKTLEVFFTRNNADMNERVQILGLSIVKNAPDATETAQDKLSEGTAQRTTTLSTSKKFVIPPNFLLQLPKGFLDGRPLDIAANHHLRALSQVVLPYGYRPAIGLITHFELLKRIGVINRILKAGDVPYRKVEIEGETYNVVSPGVCPNIAYETATDLIPQNGIWLMLGTSAEAHDVLCVISDPTSVPDFQKDYRNTSHRMWHWAYVTPTKFPIFIYYLFEALISEELLSSTDFLGLDHKLIRSFSNTLRLTSRDNLGGLFPHDVTTVIDQYLDWSCPKIELEYHGVDYFMKDIDPSPEVAANLATQVAQQLSTREQQQLKQATDATQLKQKLGLILFAKNNTTVGVIWGACMLGKYTKCMEHLSSLEPSYIMNCFRAGLDKLKAMEESSRKTKVSAHFTELLNEYIAQDKVKNTSHASDIIDLAVEYGLTLVIESNNNTQSETMVAMHTG